MKIKKSVVKSFRRSFNGLSVGVLENTLLVFYHKYKEN